MICFISVAGETGYVCSLARAYGQHFKSSQAFAKDDTTENIQMAKKSQVKQIFFFFF